MPKCSNLCIIHGRDPQLHCVNEKIARLAAEKPWGDVYATALGGRLAGEAIESAQELLPMP